MGQPIHPPPSQLVGAPVLPDQAGGLPGARTGGRLVLPAAERDRVIAEWNRTAVAYPTEVCLPQLFEAQVARTPVAVALEFEDQQLTYRELDQRANQLAHHLLELGVKPDSFVAVCAERSVEMVVALYGVLKAGAAYVPIAPDYPAQRVEFMLADAAAPVVLTQAHLRRHLPPHGGRVVCLDADWPAIARQHTSAPSTALTAAHLAYMIYTSGSTGKPKGAMNEHRGIVNRLLWMQDAYRLTAADVVLQKTPFSFDVSVWEFFWPLLTGASLVVAKPGGHQDPPYLVELIERRGVTVLHFVPSMLQVFLESADRQRCRSLRHVICSGEALPYELQERFFAKLDAQLHNLYGPTEAAVDVTAWTCRRASPLHLVPIGRPIANTQCHILDPQLQPVAIGEPGELHLGGVQVGRGYHHRPELTAERFIPDPFRDEPGARLYKTGDLARYLSDGAIEYLGRLDHQVKLHGFRIELGEIEAALGEQAAVKQVVVVAREDQPGQKRLVAYLVGADLPAADLRAGLRRTLPDYMVPAAFVWLAAFPLSPNGKVDRQALPAPDAERTDSPDEFVAPSTPAEQTLAAIWSDVLGVRSVGVRDSFFELGGDSIRAIQVLARAQARGIPATLAQLFETPRIQDLARQAGAAVHESPQVTAFGLVVAGDRQRLPAGLADAYPATRLQVGMFYHNELHPGSAVYHDVFSFRIQFPYSEGHLRTAIQRFVARHPTMRTSFDLAGYSEPLQLVHQAVSLPFTMEDLQGCPAEEQKQRLTEWIAAEKYRAFDRAAAPLLRVHVQVYGAGQFQLIVSFHHAILDGWSLAVMLTEVLQEYAGLINHTGAQTSAPSIPYRAYVALERQALAAAESRQFWAAKLAGANLTHLPRWPISSRAGGTEQVRSAECQVPVAVYDGLKRLAQAARVPLKSVLQAAHYRVMSFLHGQPDVISGSLTNGRPEDIDGERMIGLFLNTLPLRVQLTGGSWLDLCQQVFAEERALLPHRRYPLADIQQAAGREALFESAFDFVHFHVYRELQGYQDLGFMEGHYFEANSFTLFTTFMVDVTTTQLQFHLDYDPAELAGEQIQAIREYYTNTLAAMAAEPTGRYEQFSPWSAAERQRLLVEWNATSREVPPDQCLHQLFEAQAARHPAAVALVVGERSLSYAELNHRANRLVPRLRALGVGPDVLVALCMARSVEMMVALLAIHKAGGAYVPLDPAYPAEWLAFVLADTRAPVLVTESNLMKRLPPHAAQVVCLDAERGDPGTTPNPVLMVRPHHLAYVIYTSGSTGQPKGVAIEHRNAVALAAWAQDVFPAAELAGVLASTSICFDLSIFEIFVTWSAGGKVILAENAFALAKLPAANQVTLINTVPSAIKELLRQRGLPASVRVVNLAGEPTPVSLVQDIHQLPHVQKVYDLYGPSETTTYSTFALRQPAGPATIGRPIAHTQVYLLDARGQPVPVGVAGELFIGGAGLARGYLHRPELTAEKFVADPFRRAPGARLYRTGDLARYRPDGNLEFLGRTDRQVKIRGFRIELGEIQARLHQHPQLREAVVIAREDTPGDRRLVAYFVGRTEPAPNVSALREFLLAQVPAHMVPSAFVKLAALPLTPNGKIDVRALPKPETGRGDLATAYASPQTPAERIIAGIWQEVLEVDRVGLHDNFFDLGGHSLQLVRVHGKLGAAFQADLPLVALFEYPTVTGLARFLSRGPAGPSGLDHVPARAQAQRQAAARQRQLQTDRRTR